MSQFAVYFQKIVNTDPEQNGSEAIVRCLLKNNASEIDSYISGVIEFRSNQSLSHWFEAFTTLRKDFHFRLVEVKESKTIEPSSWYSKGIRDLFLKEVDELKKS